jgi:hypothetical protein
VTARSTTKGESDSSCSLAFTSFRKGKLVAFPDIFYISFGIRHILVMRDLEFQFEFVIVVFSLYARNQEHERNEGYGGQGWNSSKA